MTIEDPGPSRPEDDRHLEWTLVDSAVGPLFLAATRTGLVRVEFHGTERRIRPLAEQLGAEPVRPPAGREVLLAEPVRQLAAYFAGDLRRFELPLDWRLSAGFNRVVLRELERSVPYGSVVGYGELAARVGQPGGGQAVGAAMGSNPLPVVVPCHRVVESDGGIGGFGGGLEAKRTLLALEGVLPQPLF
ncbi:methylated-DNA--[protein]-cysteine S-methyltransferase [Streptomyces sp. NRRL S-87]|uniref:methylated-DNA--[protein]-cysteine S-methyltransferase n=1 Tax=Streptomyces sp. NRRL S-87 TaxID=1463920 RepID=UPI00099D62CF|nr:methylated-DNA--[protein]-cysteine S-methyltransferase [Streptomyces sp. NRRL S-87]